MYNLYTKKLWLTFPNRIYVYDLRFYKINWESGWFFFNMLL